jgi:hypothetical protein
MWLKQSAEGRTSQSVAREFIRRASHCGNGGYFLVFQGTARVPPEKTQT